MRNAKNIEKISFWEEMRKTIEINAQEEEMLLIHDIVKIFKPILIFSFAIFTFAFILSVYFKNFTKETTVNYAANTAQTETFDNVNINYYYEISMLY